MKLDFLTGFRGLAAWWVVIYHVNHDLKPLIPEFLYRIFGLGYLAVDFFFILSGFIISYTSYSSLQEPCPKNVLKFYTKRLARVYPLHLFVLLLFLTIPLAYTVTGRPLPDTGIYSNPSFLCALLLVHNWGFFDRLTWNIPSWSISTEFAAYMVFPLIVIMTKRINSTVGVLLALAASFFAIFQVFTFLSLNSIGNSIASVGLVRCLCEFLAGVLIYRLLLLQSSINAVLSQVLVLGGALLVATCALGYVRDYLVIPLSFAMILTGCIVRGNFITRLFSLPLFVYLGELSYSTYLIHFFAKDWNKMLFLRAGINGYLWIVSYLLCVFFASMVLYKAVEVPSRTLVTDYFNRVLIRRLT